MKDTFKKLSPYLIAIVIFVIIAAVYAYPVLEGKILQASDTINGKGMTHELNEYKEETGIDSYWTGSMFSGMPTYQISFRVPSTHFLSPISKVYRLGLPAAIGMIFVYLLGFFILLRSFKINKWLSIVGAIAIAFSSYFFIIIEAGHNSKVWTIAFMAPVIAGFMLIFRKKYFIGIILTLIFSALGLMSHPQMSYYYFMMLGIFLIAELYIHIKEKRIKDFLLGTLFFGLAIIIGVGTGYSRMATNREYVKETMRGGHSEIVKESDEENKTSGLDLDYATAWSYGVGETMTLLIPNFYGGSSNYDAGTNSEIYSTLVKNGVSRKEAENFSKNIPSYWGPQPFTSGPVYVGAIIFFLFVLGLLIVKGPYKWAILVATLFSVVLSWGKNFMPLTRLFFDYFPMYDKFRAVSSILVVAEVTIPLLAILAIKAITEKQVTKEKIIQSLYISGGITAGICLIFALFGSSFFDFTSPADSQYSSQLPEWVMDAIVLERASMLKTDAWRSLLFIGLGFGVVYLFVKEKIKFLYLVLGLGILILVDMWGVNTRFFNHDNFVNARSYDAYFKKQPYEEIILQDTDPHFRVFNLTSNTFNDARTSYYLKSIGGYHGAKLRRYQDLINEHISQNNMGVLNMLNTKYFVVPGQNNQPLPQLNPGAMGNAWFVDSLLVVNTPNEESDALRSINLENTAVTDIRFEKFTNDFVPGHDSTASVRLLAYTPDVLTYEYSSRKPGTIVFSEIYYPYGWNAFIDDRPVEHFRANYALRALNVPEGNHKIRFEFRPQSVYKGERISFLFIGIMYVTILTFIVISILKWRKNRPLKP